MSSRLTVREVSPRNVFLFRTENFSSMRWMAVSGEWEPMVEGWCGVGLGEVFDQRTFLCGERVFLFDFALETHEAFEEGFWAGRASGDVDIDGNEVVDALEDGVGAVHSAAGGACAHGDAPFWFGHLVPDAFNGESHFISDGAGDDHDVGLAWGEAHDFGAEA